MPCCSWLVKSMQHVKLAPGLKSAFFALVIYLQIGARVLLLVSICLASLVESRHFFSSFFAPSVLLFCAVLSSSVICHKKENERMEQRHGPQTYSSS